MTVDDAVVKPHATAAESKIIDFVTVSRLLNTDALNADFIALAWFVLKGAPSCEIFEEVGLALIAISSLNVVVLAVDLGIDARSVAQSLSLSASGKRARSLNALPIRNDLVFLFATQAVSS